MKLTQMEYFLAAAEELNFTAAAKSLYISQPALSKQIALLEEELGAKLFLRNSRKVALTAAGKQLQQDLTHILHQLEKAKLHAAQISQTEQMQFQIGCFDGAAINDFLPEFYRHIQNFDSNIAISLHRGNFSENYHALKRDEIDLVFSLDLDEHFDESYRRKQISRRKGALIYSRQCPAAQKGTPSVLDFAQEPFLLLNPQLLPCRRSFESLKRLGIINPPVLQMENFSTLFANLELGRGYTILTKDAADRFPTLDKIVLEEEFGVWVVAFWKKENSLAELLMDHYLS